MKEFTEALRYEYPLKPDSVVIDAGGYEGNFALELHRKYGCHVHVFEPIPAFAENIKARVAAYPKIRVWNAGIGGRERTEKFHVQNDSTGIFAGSTNVVEAKILDLADVLRREEFEFAELALVKLNIEGSEYEALESLLGSNVRRREGGNAVWPTNLQVQFHTCAPDWEARYADIAARLAEEYRLTWRTPFIWENWELK